jgi:hypothetical protein
LEGSPLFFLKEIHIFYPIRKKIRSTSLSEKSLNMWEHFQQKSTIEWIGILVFSLPISLFAQEWKLLPLDSGFRGRLGGTGQVFQSRFMTEKDSKDSQFWTDGTWNGVSILAEQRNQRELGSIRYESNFLEMSYGHRYKSVPGFFFGKDPDFFSALTSDQPIQRSGYFNILPYHVSPGIFWLPDITGNGIGYSLLAYEKKMAFTYSPDTEVRSLYSNFFREKIPISDSTLIYWTWQGEAIGTTNNYFGTEFAKVEILPLDVFIEGSVYKNAFGKLNQGKDSFQEFEKNPLVSFGNMGLGAYNRIELTDSIDGSIRESIGGAQIGVWDFGWFSPVIRYREYWKTESKDSERIQEFTRAPAILLQGKNKQVFWSIGREIRGNKDRTTEANISWQGDGWNLETSALFQAEENQFRTPFLRYYGDDKLQTVLTDRIRVLRFRFKTKFLDCSVSASEKAERRATLLYMNIQFLLMF